MAENVVRQLRRISDTGRTVVCTIHQPASQVFNHFSHLLLLAEGRTAYLGTREAAVKYFADLGLPCPTYYNPADFFIHQLAVVPNNREESLKHIETITDSYAASEWAQANSSWLDEVDIEKESRAISTKRQYNLTWIGQVRLLLDRAWLICMREPSLMRARIMQTVTLGIIVGLMYFQLGSSQKDVQNKIGGSFFLLVSQAILAMFSTLQVFPHELPVFMREYTSGLYRVDTYFLGRTCAEIPMQIIFPIIFCCITWWMAAFRNTAQAFFLFTIITVITSNAAVSLGYLVSTSVKSIGVALALGPVTLMPMLLFAGLLLNTEDIPPYFRWMEVFSFFKYGKLSINTRGRFIHLFP